MSDGFGIGISGATRFSGLRGRTADGTGRAGVKYPSPFFDIAQTYLPPTIKDLLKWCRFYSLTHPLINTVIHKLSEYPITEIVIDEENRELKEKWELLLYQVLKYRSFQIEVGLDYFTYGICIATIHFPFTKYLVCRHCKHKEKASQMVYKWRDLNYVIECDKCGTQGPAIVEDFYEKDVNRIRLHRWNPEYVHIDPGFAGADPIYTFELPQQVRNDVLVGKPNVINTIPDVFIEALRRNKYIVFNNENIFVFKRPSISQKDEGWGMPLILPVLKDAFYLQILRKSQEAVMLEHIVPLRIIFPQAATATSDPYSTLDLQNWKFRIEQEIMRWKYDPNYVAILPIPIGNQSFGGDGKALDLAQEMQVWSEQIVAGMGVPREFVWGGLSFSGSNVSMRMLENMFLGYRTDHQNMLNNFVISRVASYMDWTAVRSHMKRFKMADDLQKTSLYFQLNQAQKVSDHTLLSEADLDFDVEESHKKIELRKQMDYQRSMQVAQASIQGEAGVIQAGYQAKVQQAMLGGQQPAQQGQPPGPGQPTSEQPGAGQQGEMVPGGEMAPGMPEGSTVSPENAQQQPGMPQELASPMGAGGGGANLLYMAKRAVKGMEDMDPAKKQAELNRMRTANPQLYSVVMRYMQSKRGSQENPLNPLQSPLPQLKPSRRVSSVGV